MNKFVYNSFYKSSVMGIKKSLNVVFNTNKPVIVCIGSDLAIGDSLGPLTGTKLYNLLNGKAYVYGTLKSPITAKETKTLSSTIKLLHPNSKILAIDAGVGNEGDVGLIKVSDYGLNPGLGVNKNLPKIGDASVIGIVAEKTNALSNITSSTRLNLIYYMSEIIANAVSSCF